MDAPGCCVECSSPDIYFSRKSGSWVCEDCQASFAEPAVASGRPNLFFSYGHDSNTGLVLRLRGDLERRGYRVWLDQSEVKAGDDWRRTVTDGLISADTVISFLSRHAVRDPGVCLDELRIALCVRDRVIKSVLLEPEESVATPSSLSHIQWLDMSDWRARHDRGPDEFEPWYAEKLSALLAVIQDSNAEVFAGEITRLRRVLAPQLSDARERYLLAQPFVGRDWLSVEVEEWRQSVDGSRALVILGGPGLGKSAFAARQLHYAPQVVCGVFCEWRSGVMADASTILRTIAFKLASKLPDYRRVLLETLAGADSARQDSLQPAALFDILLGYPLSQLVDGERERSVILIDGLDEAGGTTENSLAWVLAENLSRLPRWIGVVITSRPEPVILEAFAGMRPLMLQPDEARNLADVYHYFAVSLAAQLAENPRKLQVLDDLTERSEGSFLFARLLVDEVASGRLGLDRDLEHPRGLRGFYTESFRRRYTDSTGYRATRSVLELIVAGRELPGQVIVALAEDPYQVNDALAEMGSMILRSDARVRGSSRPLGMVGFCHKSLVDWLSDSSASGRFYVDPKRGAGRLAAYARLQLEKAADRDTQTADADPLLAYLRGSLVDWHVRADAWSELEDFLIDPGTPLEPYWRALPLFPATHDDSRLCARLWASSERPSFLASLQREGEAELVRDVLERLARHIGFGALGAELVNLLVDVVHLGGGYRDAVRLCEEYLTTTDPAAQSARPDLVRLAIRKLHHSMFFMPVTSLLAEAHELLSRVDPVDAPEEYNELLFLIGGNLGVLSGDFEQAGAWLAKSSKFAHARGASDFIVRAVRKQVDLLWLEGRQEEALELASGYLPESLDGASRYEIYLTAAWAEACRGLGRFVDATRAYESVARASVARGIKGFQAHAVLGLAAVAQSQAQTADALALARRARAEYERIGHCWGTVAVELVAGAASLQECEVSVGEALSLAQDLGYRYEAGCLERLAEGKPAGDYRLLFL